MDKLNIFLYFYIKIQNIQHINVEKINHSLNKTFKNENHLGENIRFHFLKMLSTQKGPEWNISLSLLTTQIQVGRHDLSVSLFGQVSIQYKLQLNQPQCCSLEIETALCSYLLFVINAKYNYLAKISRCPNWV